MLLQFKESLKSNAETLKQLAVKNGIQMEDIVVIVAEIIEQPLTEKGTLNIYRPINYYKDLYLQLLSGEGILTLSFIRHAFY